MQYVGFIGALGALVGAEHLNLFRNSVVDIAPLRDLQRLVTLSLSDNRDLTDISPLFDNGLPVAQWVRLKSTSVSCADVARLQAMVSTVDSDCP